MPETPNPSYILRVGRADGHLHRVLLGAQSALCDALLLPLGAPYPPDGPKFCAHCADVSRLRRPPVR